MSVRSIEAEVSIKSGVQAECTIGREVVVEVHDDINLEALTATANGSYRPTQGVDGWDRVTVAVPERQPVTEPLSVTANGQYAPAQGVDGFSDVTVNVPERIPVTESLSVTENGTYEPTEGIDGYGRVSVAVPERVPDIESLTVTENGTYTAEGDGYNPVVVSVPPTVPNIEPLTVTEDGVYTSSGDGYNPVTVNTGVASLRQEIASAETESGCSPLTDGLTALTTYANEVTGAEDATLSDAVETLVNGYGFLGRKVKTGVLKLNSKFSSKVSILYTDNRGIGFTPSCFAIWVVDRTGLSHYSVLYAFYSSTPQYKATINLSTASGGIGATASESAKETINSNLLYTSGNFIYFEGSANYALEATEYNWIAIE